jgi:DNA-binding XRE family transcriptional regulator
MNPGAVILHQIVNFASRAASYKSFWVTSRQEPREFLEQSTRRASLRFCLPGMKIVMQAGGKEEHDWLPMRTWREHLGLTQADVAARASMTQGAYAQMENSSKPRRASLKKITTAMGLTAEQLDF